MLCTATPRADGLDIGHRDLDVIDQQQARQLRGVARISSSEFAGTGVGATLRRESSSRGTISASTALAPVAPWRELPPDLRPRVVPFVCGASAPS